MRLKAKQAARGKIESSFHEEMYYTTKELSELADLFQQKPGKCVWEWILRVWNNSGRGKKLDQVKFLDIGPLSGNSRFTM